jgi:chromate transporter
VFTTATFIGWHIAGVGGAVVATLGIFAPSFFFAAVIDRVVAWSQRSSWFAAFLRGVSSGSIALMAVVIWRLADEAFVDAMGIATFVVAILVVRLGLLSKAWGLLRRVMVGRLSRR